MSKREGIRRSIHLAEQRFFEDYTRTPDILILNPDGYALMLEELGSSFLDDGFQFEGKFIAVVTHPGFPLFRLAASGE